MKGKEHTLVIVLLITTWIGSQDILCQYQGSGDDLGFEDDDDFPISSGGGPFHPPRGPVLPSPSPSAGGIKPPAGRGKPPAGRDKEEGSGCGELDEILGRKTSNPPPVGTSTSRTEKVWISTTKPTSSSTRRSTWSHDDDDDGGDDDIYETSGDLPLEKNEEVPRVGGEIIVDPVTTRQSTIRTRSTTPSTTSASTSLATDPVYTKKPSTVSTSTRSRPTTASTSTTTSTSSSTASTSTTAIKTIRPDWNLSTTAETPENTPSFWARLHFFKVFTDPLILAGIIGGAVLALLCIVLIVMFMIYRVRKKDEGSYALGEPRRAYDIKYTRTNDQEYFA